MSARHSVGLMALTAVLVFTPSTSEGAFRMQLVDRVVGGDVESVVTSGSYAFVAAREVAYVVDLGDPTAPEVVAQLDPDGISEYLLLDGNFLYVGAAGAGVQVYDVSDPTNPDKISQASFNGWGMKMHLQGDRLFVAAGDGGLVVVDVSDPYSPWPRGNYTEPMLAISDVYVDGNVAYCAAGIFELDLYVGYLYTFDVSNWQPIPTFPVQPEPVDYDLPRRVHVSDGILHMAVAGSTRRQLISPETPLPTWDFLATSFHPLGSNLVMTDFTGVRVYAGETELAVLELPESANDGFLDGDTLYRAAGRSGFQWVDLGEPGQPALAGSFRRPASLREMVARPGVVYAGSYSDELYVLDTSGPETTIATTLPGRVIDLRLGTDDLLYRSTGYTLEVIDLADPLAPTVASTLELGWSYDLTQSGRRLYVADSANEMLRVLDASDPRTGLSSLGNLPLSTRPNTIAAYGDIVYVSDQWSDLTIFDATDPTAIEVVSTEDRSSIRGLRVAGDRLYLATGGVGVEIYDLSDPRAPSLLGATPGNIWSFDVSENLLTQYEIGADEIQVYDVADPTAPSVVASHEFYPTALAVRRVGRQVHAAMLNVGYHRYAIDTGITSTPPARADSMALGSRPNPARGRTEIFFVAPADGAVELELYDLAGRRVRDWRRQAHAGQTLTLVWDGRDAHAQAVSQGVYVLRARSAGKEAFHRIAWIR